MAEASGIVRASLERDARSLRDLVLSIRTPEPAVGYRARLLATVNAYLTTIYGDLAAPQLHLQVADDLVVDWVVETMLLQIVQEALDNVRDHSHARRIEITIDSTDDAVTVRVADDGVGFDPATTRERTGTAAMRSSAAVLGGTFTIESDQRRGTTVTARLGPQWPVHGRSPGRGRSRAAPVLRLMPEPAAVT